MFFLILVVGAALRFYALGDLPHGVYHDEAYYGLDAVSVLNGARPVFFPANNGREPLYIYLVSLSLAVFGRTPFGLRLASAVIGVLTIPVTYLLGRALFNRRVGLLAMAVCAVTFWPVALSRVSFRAGALPLFLGLAIALGWLGWQQRALRVWLAGLGGVAYGLAFNTYTAARVTPLALLLFAVIAFLIHRRERQERRELNNDSALSAVKLCLVFLLTAALVVAPLAGYALAHPAQVFAREGQVSIFETKAGNPAWVLLQHLGLALGMFGFQGDLIARHNLPGRPVFDLWTFAFFLIGLIVLAARSRRTPAAAFVLIWLGVTLLPTALAEDTPHFLRSISLLPVLWLAPAVGFEALVNRKRGKFRVRGSRSDPRTLNLPFLLLPGVALTASALLTAYDYFVTYTQSPITNYYFESAATELADEFNSHPAYAARIDDRLWDNFASLRFLIADRAGANSPDHVLLAVWPYEADAVRAAVAALPAYSQISAHAGALARGDLESLPYSLYTLYLAEPARQPAEPLTARFGEAIELRGTTVVESADRIHIRLGWAASRPVNADYHIYVHVLSGGEIVAQADGEPLQSLFHFSWLRPGDILNDSYVLPRGEETRVGVYAPDGAPLGEPVILK